MNSIKNEYKKNLKNVPIYIIWDRDYDSKTKNVKEFLENFRNAQDNEYNMNGLLLLSYPCFEVYELSSFQKTLWQNKYCLSEEAKKEWTSNHNFKLENINEKTMLLAVENMHRSLIEESIYNYDPSNFKRVNRKIFDNMEKSKKKYDYFKALSLISIMFIDLGIIREIEQ